MQASQIGIMQAYHSAPSKCRQGDENNLESGVDGPTANEGRLGLGHACLIEAPSPRRDAGVRGGDSTGRDNGDLAATVYLDPGVGMRGSYS